ncbi:MAG: glycosyltransferase family 2 protein [Proteobacteria bacterium]|nr:glycosyltransferase family 2 protein [Pseudomonadota bacterium]
MVQFSIIMPVLDQERYLAEAIGSVQAQTFDDWELLVVDDGSTDASLAIAQRFARDDPRIRVLRHPDGGRHGAAASRNFAIRQARGRWLAFLDGDDLFLPRHLATHVAAFAAWPQARCIYGATRWLDEASGATRDEDLGPVAGHCHAPPDLVRRIIVNHEGEVPCTNMVTMERAIALEVGGFEEAFNLFEDQTLWVKVFARHPVGVIADCCAIYRQHPRSTSARSERGDLPGYVSPQEASRQFLCWMRDWLDQHTAPDAALDGALGLWLDRFDARATVRLKARLRVRAAMVGRRLRWRIARRFSRR